METTDHSLEQVEIALLLEAIYLRYGYDFRQYAKASLHRRLSLCLSDLELSSFSELIPRLLRDPDIFATLLARLSVTVTQPFRHPFFFRVFRESVLPKLRSYPFIKIWHAGCATGEEVYSMAILLQEEGLYDRCQLYGTDYNLNSIQKAREGIYEWQTLAGYEKHYKDSGGQGHLKDYFFIKHGFAKIDPALTRHVSFDYHNLVSDGIFGEMNVIICQNVMIYFNQTLQDAVLSTFAKSLVRRGYLCLGSRETLRNSAVYDDFETVNEKAKIYRKSAADE